MSLPTPPPLLEPRTTFAPGEPSQRRAGWKDRLDDPLNRFYRYPVARLLVRYLVPTPVTPNQLSFAQPFLAAAAGYLITYDDRARILAAAALFEVRSVLDCADGTLARARRRPSAGGHAIDAVADWLGCVLLYAGLAFRFHLHPPPPGAWRAWLSVDAVLALALAQGALRSFAADHYRRELVSIFEHGRDEPLAVLRRKALALGPDASLFARADVAIGRLEHLVFTHARFDPHARDDDRAARLQRRAASPLARAVAALWSVSNGDAFLSIVVLSMIAGRIWEVQLFFATAGWVWILGVIALTARLLRG